MTVEIDIRLAAEEFAFGQVFQTAPDLRVEFDRIVPMGRDDEYLPFVWVMATKAAPQPELIEEAFTESPDIEGYELLTAIGDKRLYRLHWLPTVESLLDGILQARGTIVEGYGEHGEWAFRLRFATQDDISQFDDYCATHEIARTIDRVTDIHPPEGRRLDLSPEQLEVMRVAYSHGYFEVPRRISQTDLGDLLGITHQAASERLRRANEKIIEQSMASLFEIDPPTEK
ncbi:helix-turn-helix domain-containing protein [Haladaptatus sp. NG-SE-30]